jgi:DNA mismatch repair enzyme (predicted ATPase)
MPEVAAKTRSNQFIFVNNRFIRSHYLNHAVQQAYKDLIPKDSHPFFVLFLELNPTLVDVNVHPTKQEIKFDDERLVYSFVNAAVKHALSKYSIAPSLDFTLDASIQSLESISKPMTSLTIERTKNDFLFQSFTEKGKAHFLDKKPVGTSWQELYKTQQEFVLQKDMLPSQADTNIVLTEEFKPDFIQVSQSYIVVTTKQGMMIIDQHLAHQRILYERYSKAFEQTIPIQQCLLPITVDCSPSEATLLSEMMPDLYALGFAIEPFGNHTFIIQGVPSDLKAGYEKQTILGVLDAYMHASTDLTLEPREKLIRTMAKQRATPANKHLDRQEMQRLFSDLFLCEMPHLSPEGKNIFRKLSLIEIARMIQYGS